MIFNSVDEFREVVSKYAMVRGVKLTIRPNERKRVRVKYKEGCPWLLFGSLDRKSNKFIIKTYNSVHKCYKSNRNRLCNSKFIARHFRERILSQPEIKIREIQQLCRESLNMFVGKTVCRRAKNKVIASMIGDYRVEYGRLHDYADEIKRSNPSTTCFVKVKRDEDCVQQFKRFYVCFDAIKKGYKAGCRPILGFDGCFLMGPCKGQLLCCVSKDDNNQMFPVTWGAVDIENKKNWKWFISTVKMDLGMETGASWTMVIDMQKGLDSAIVDELPNVEHRMCARHMVELG
ncbi:uncharacterized protein LOC127794758 [Diospyros lotus]|uniref:uncharacterized protein LOC127794758 n=1 Tax=Diospyros lotus TaxID=55363 RepID=UPI00224F7FE4|nr:uncharacterized protein LOC127794758 [Diospyros lotus]